MEYITNTLGNLVQQTAFLNLTWGNYIMTQLHVFSFILQSSMGLNRFCLYRLHLVCSW